MTQSEIDAAADATNTERGANQMTDDLITNSDRVGNQVQYNGQTMRIAAYLHFDQGDVFRLVELERRPPYLNWITVPCDELPETEESEATDEALQP